MKKGQKKAKITEKEKDLAKFSGRLIFVIMDKKRENKPIYDLINDSGAISRLIADMKKKGIPLPDNARQTIKKHIHDKVNMCDSDWLKWYCEFFKCPADYLLGFMDKDIMKFQERTGLTDKAIRRLITNKDYQFVINTLLEKNSIRYFVEALQNDYFYQTQTNYISQHLYKTNDKGRIIEKDKKLHGVTIDDLEIYKTNLDSGYKDLQENFAIICFDELKRDENLRDYFFDQAAKKFSDQLENDIQKLT